MSNFQDPANIGIPASHKHDVPEDDMSRCCRGALFRFDLLTITLRFCKKIYVFKDLFKSRMLALPSDFDDSAVQTLSTFVT